MIKIYEIFAYTKTFRGFNMITEAIKRPNVLTGINIKNDIINRLSTEETNSSIARSYNVTQGRISQIKSENQALIDQKKSELINLLPDIVEVSRQDIQDSKEVSRTLRTEINSHDENVQRAVTNKLKFKALTQKLSQDILKIASIFPTSALLNFNQFNQDNRSVNIEPSIMTLFSSAPGGFSDNMEAVDMEEVSDDDKS